MKHFNIRVYGLLIYQGQILLSDEYIAGRYITKLPGGGLEFGEGSMDCLKREFMEELGIEIENIKHFYTTDFFQQSAFHPDHQIISLYYTCSSSQSEQIEVSLTQFSNPKVHNSQAFRWVKIEDITADLFTLPIDKILATIITENPENLAR